MEEVFKTLEIEGLERYSISNKGNVMSSRSKTPILLKPQTDALGYSHVRLFPEEPIFGMYPNGRGKIPKLEKIHRLVATHFLEVPTDPNEIWTVNHKDGDKSNNHVDNLEWLTHSDNIRHSWDIGLRDNSSRKTAERKWRPVKVTYKDGTIEYFKSQMHVAAALECTPGTVWNKVESKYKDPYGKTGWKAERINKDDLPPGETFKSILGIEEKMFKIRDRFWPKEKMREYQRRKKRSKKLGK